MTNEQEQRELVVTIGIGIITIMFLVIIIGIESFMAFVLDKFLLLMANAFLIVTLIDILKGGAKKEMYVDYITFIIIGAVFMFVYAMFSHQTAFSIVTNSLKYIVYVIVIAGIVRYLKREI
jgi:hypothetical protein